MTKDLAVASASTRVKTRVTKLHTHQAPQTEAPLPPSRRAAHRWEPRQGSGSPKRSLQLPYKTNHYVP